MSVRLAGGLAALALVAACSSAPVADDGAALSAVGALTTRDGTFTATQAERGRSIYNDFCSSCHPVEFYETQLAIWQNAVVGEFFESLSATMPSENPGALATSQYLDVIAYILSITGSPPGEQELTIDNAGNVQIVND